MTYLSLVTPSPLPVPPAVSTLSPLEVIVHSDPATGWDILAALGPLAIFVGALLATIISLRTLKQRRDADRNALDQKQGSDDRSEWWRRAQWALDHAVGGNPDAKTLGLVTLDKLARSKLASDEEIQLFDVAWEAVQPRQVEEPPALILTDMRRRPGSWFRYRMRRVVDADPGKTDNGITGESEEDQ